MSRMLLVWPYAPWPPVTGTAQRLARLTEELLLRDVEVALVVTDTQDADAIPTAVPLLAAVPRNTNRLWSALAVPGALRRREPVFFAFFRRRNARAAVASAVARWRPDIVWTHGVAGIAAVQGVIDDSKVVLDLSDAEPDRFARLAETVGGVRGLLWRIDARRVRRWVGRRLPGLRAVTVVSDADRAVYAQSAPNARFVLVPNGVDARDQLRADPDNGTAIFLGDLGYPPNAEGLGWFVEHVLPRTPALVELQVVGRGRAPRAERVRALGFVDDLGTAWATSTVMVVPIHSGGGSRLKVLDAFGAGVAVVSTTFGVSGIDAVAERDYIRADSAEEFADALTRLLADGDRRQELAANAHRLVVGHYSWHDCLVPLLRELGIES
jgi:glycosyltransferase involved in cell wall biosynthesis